MCQTLVEGGRRCASHTRPAFHAALNAVNTAPSRRNQIDAQVAGMDAVAFHAATPAGAKEVADLLVHADRTGDTALAVLLRTGQQMSVGVNDEYAAIAAELTAHRDAPEQAPEQAWDPGVPNAEAGEHWSIAEGGTRWHEGGCGAFAIAMTERWPHLKIAAEMYDDHGAESVAHAWAYDPDTNKRFHIFGAEDWAPTTRPDYDAGSHRVLLDQSPDDVRRLFRGGNCGEDSIYDGMDVACEMFDPDFVADDEFDRNHLYFW